jgi:hypothetical protein
MFIKAYKLSKRVQVSVVSMPGLKNCLKPCILKCLEDLGGEATMSQIQRCLLGKGIETYTESAVMTVASVLGALARWGKVEKVGKFHYRLKK